MAPVFDMLNHNHKPNIGWKPNAETHALELYALSDIHSGEELTLNYGKSADGNKKSLKSYGFTTSDPTLLKNDKLEFTAIELTGAFDHLLTAAGRVRSQKQGFPKFRIGIEIFLEF